MVVHALCPTECSFCRVLAPQPPPVVHSSSLLLDGGGLGGLGGGSHFDGGDPFSSASSSAIASGLSQTVLKFIFANLLMQVNLSVSRP
jgi:hypothetical protein